MRTRRYFAIIRLRELRKILSFLELYRQQYREDMPIVMCGDFNGSPQDPTYQLLRERNFTSSCTDDTPWVTHKTHVGSLLCCDYVFVQNPGDRVGPMDTHWQAMIFRSTKQRWNTARKELQVAFPLPAPLVLYSYGFLVDVMKRCH